MRLQTDMKRLFLFSAYSEDGSVGASVLHYVRVLSSFGDVVFRADNEISEEGIRLLKPLVSDVQGQRHGEYDFGSYKRAWQWACANLDVSGYDRLYMVNDSVFGPLMDMDTLFSRLEEGVPAASCLVYNPARKHPHMQSWFIGLGKEVFLAEYFSDFISGVKRMETKEQVCQLYEDGFTRLLMEKGIKPVFLFEARGRAIYNSPLSFCRKGLPFVKKVAWTRHNGSLGHQLVRIAEEFPGQGTEAMLSQAREMWGKEYVESLMHGGRLDSVRRYMKYLYGKLLK